MTAPTLDAVLEPSVAPQAAPPRALHDDPLVLCLVWLSRHHGRERSIEALCAGLPVGDRLEPAMAVRVLREAGFQATLLQRPVAELHPLLMPAVLLLKNGGAWITTGRREAEGGGGSSTGTSFDIVMPGRVELKAVAPLADLEAEHDGWVLVATPAESLADPTDPDPQSHWLWGTMRRFLPYYRPRCWRRCCPTCCCW
jgi:ATP-binding cassette subfamily C protein LapB